MILFNRSGKNNFYLKSFFILLFLVGVFFVSSNIHAAIDYEYTPLSPIPGFETSSSGLKGFVESIYQFGIWTVGIAAILMITIGGFMYMMSVGNTSKAEVAKGVVTDALIGLAVALAAYLILFIINPDLVNINISLKSTGTSSSTSTGTGTGTTSTGTGTGNCKSITTGPCSPENLKSACSWDAEKASAICLAESGAKEGKASEVDICKDGKAFSYGLFQINLTCQCKSAFTPVKEKGCVNKACSVSNQSTYNSCVATYTTASSNISKACEIYKSQGWNGWGVNSKCGF